VTRVVDTDTVSAPIRRPSCSLAPPRHAWSTKAPLQGAVGIGCDPGALAIGVHNLAAIRRRTAYPAIKFVPSSDSFAIPIRPRPEQQLTKNRPASDQEVTKIRLTVTTI
jgi:hypothetical protein